MWSSIVVPVVLFYACEHPSMGQKGSYFNILVHKEHLSPEIMSSKSFTPSAAACRKAIHLIYVNPDQMRSIGMSLVALHYLPLWSLLTSK